MAGFVLGIISVVVSLVGLGFTLAIAAGQRRQSDEMYDLLVQIRAGRASEEEAVLESDVEADPDPEPAADDASVPRSQEEFVEALKKAGANLEWNNLKWDKKAPPSGGRGNLGWFVQDKSHNERWFVHKGRGVGVRRALPVDRLQAFEEQTGQKPTDIRLDYQVKLGGNSAWYVETYAGQFFKISKGGRGKSEITVTPIDPEDG